MLNILTLLFFLLSLCFFYNYTSRSSVGFSFPHLVCPARWARRSQATVVLLAQELAVPIILWAVACSAWGSWEAAEVTVGLNPTVREGSGGSDRTEEWVCCLLPAEQWLVCWFPLGPALGSLLPPGPCPGPHAAGLLHLTSGYCFGRG